MGYQKEFALTASLIMPNLCINLCIHLTPETLPTSRNSITQICFGGLASKARYEAMLAVPIVLVLLLRSSVFSFAQLHTLVALLFK